MLKNPAGILAQIETTFTHGVFKDCTRKPNSSQILTVYEKSTGHTRRRRKIRVLLNYARAHRVTHLLIRLQRWFLRLLSLWRSKRFAVAMSMHARLGCEAGGLGALGPDLLALVMLGS